MSYYDRAMRARDRRYVAVLDKLGYGTRDMAIEPVTRPAPVVEPEPEPETPSPLAVLRAEYKSLYGKRPSPRWDEDQLIEKINAKSIRAD